MSWETTFPFTSKEKLIIGFLRRKWCSTQSKRYWQRHCLVWEKKIKTGREILSSDLLQGYSKDGKEAKRQRVVEFMSEKQNQTEIKKMIKEAEKKLSQRNTSQKDKWTNQDRKNVIPQLDFRSQWLWFFLLKLHRKKSSQIRKIGQQNPTPKWSPWSIP